MSEAVHPNETLVDLLVKKAIEGLSAQEEAYLSANPLATQRELRRFEQAAAAVSLGGIAMDEPLPASLRERLNHHLQQVLPVTGPEPQPQPPAQAGSAAPADGQGEQSAPHESESVELQPQAARSPAAPANSYGWWAAAACLLFAVVLLGRLPKKAAVQGAQSQRAALLARADTVTFKWNAADSAEVGVSGDLVWNPAAQQGSMRFIGLPKNDPTMHQYQLWIFDAERDERYPVDGGVFDMPAGSSEVIVPIRAALPVRAAKLFTVTIERPGGAVVSEREHIVVTAQSD